MRWAALVTAAGHSRRLGGNKKEWLKLGRGTVIASSVAPFLRQPECVTVLVTHPQGERERMRSALGDSTVQLCPGGETRAHSVWLGLRQLAKTHPDIEYVLVHDGARPWVSDALIERVLHALAHFPAVIPVLRCHEALKQMDPTEDELIAHHLPRHRYALAQTPQAFAFGPLVQCYSQAWEQGLGSEATDDAELWQLSGGSVHTVEGERRNVKITHPEDIALLHPDSQRCGQGYDVHRLEEGRALILGGVEIASDRGPVAHSDGDALLHALIDALLGATALGDVGQLFPDTDPNYAGCDSAGLLRHTLRMVRQAGWQVGNVDSTVILERPKLGPHRDAIRHRLADLLDLPVTCVSLKAKTAEGLGPVGRGDAVECWVNLLVFRRSPR